METFNCYDHDDIKVENEGTTMTKLTGYRYSSVYGLHKFSKHDQKVITWKFKINSLTERICVGITASDNGQWIDDCFYKMIGGYGYSSLGWGYADGKFIEHYNGDLYKQGDQISMVFDAGKGILSFWRNDMKQENIKMSNYQQKDETFRMCVSVCNHSSKKGDSISLIDFKEVDSETSQVQV